MEARTLSTLRLGLQLLLALAFAFSTAAFCRDFPQTAKRGQVTAFSHPVVSIGKRNYRLVPASKIFSEQNMIIMPSAMPAKAEVMYELDFSGNVRHLWLLTPDEAKSLGPASRK